MNLLHKLINKYPKIRKILKPLLSIRGFLKKKRMRAQVEILNNLEDLLINDPVIKVDEFKGMFVMDSRSDLFKRIIINKNYEPLLVDLCEKYINRNRDVIDVGANIGFYTVFFATVILDNKVVSIEPSKNAIKHLRRNIKMNNVSDKVEVFEGVATDSVGSIQLKTIRGKEEYSSVGKMVHPSISTDKWNIEEVKSTTLDILTKEMSLDPGFLKVDAEGSEHLIFKGSEQILRKKRPIILSELSNFLLKKNNSSSEQVIKIIKSKGYDVFNPIYPSLELGKMDFSEIICFPRELGVDF